MSSLANRQILLGISGGIAAYKSAELVRLLKAQGAQVRVVMTPAAQAFITPLTLQALSGEPVHVDLLDTQAEAAMGHIALARWAEAILIAPATADVMARLATGQANDLLTTLCLASRAPVFIAPAMNQAMWRHPATQANLALLQSRGLGCFGPADGQQACGDLGPGRMMEPADLVTALAQALAPPEPGRLAGQRWLITAGPTREPLDPVRYLSNHSSGKMGFALAAAALAQGAQVSLVAGPTALGPPAGADYHPVETAEQMLAESLRLLPGCQVVVAAAAVADYRLANPSPQKLKKQGKAGLTLELVPNPDVIASLVHTSRDWPDRPYVMAFAAETQNLLAEASAKRQRKGVDAIAANDVTRPGLGFNSDHNALSVIDGAGLTELGPASKTDLAQALVAYIALRQSRPDGGGT